MIFYTSKYGLKKNSIPNTCTIYYFHIYTDHVAALLGFCEQKYSRYMHLKMNLLLVWNVIIRMVLVEKKNKQTETLKSIIVLHF